MAVPLTAALSQMNPVNTASPISLRSALMLLYHKFQGHPMSIVPCDSRGGKMYAFVVLILACRMFRLCYHLGFYHPNSTCGKSKNCNVSCYVNLFLFLLGLLPRSLSLSLWLKYIFKTFSELLVICIFLLFYVYLETNTKTCVLYVLGFHRWKVVNQR
jgi:hypothetical protein